MGTDAHRTESTGSYTRAHRITLAAIFAMYGALYVRTAMHTFVWDDVDAIVNNPLYEGPWLAGLRASQHDHLDLALRQMAEVRPAHDSWRPVLYLSHRIERTLYGRSPAGHHLHNVVLGALALVLVFWLMERWLENHTQALAATGLFALHPLQVEAVAYVSGRGDLLSACFALASLGFALRGRTATHRAPWVALSTITFLLALLSKEACIGLPLALGLIAWSHGRVRTHLVDLCAHTAGLAAYLVLRLSQAPTADGQASLTGALHLPGLWLEYARVVLLPFDLSIARPFDRVHATPGMLALTGVLVLLVLASRKPLAGIWSAVRLAVGGLLFALVLIGPSAIVAKITNVAADRYAYLPLAGYAVALISTGRILAEIRPSVRPLLVGVGTAFALSWLVVTALQVPVWRDARTLYEHAQATEPSSSFAAFGLGLVHARAGDWEEAGRLFEHAVTLEPNNGRAWNNLSVTALERGDYPRALEAAQRALDLSTLKFRALYNLASAQLQLGRRDQGCASLRRALEINPTYARARTLLAAACVHAP